MKKLNLKLGGIGEMLSREQMKKVVGGNYGVCPTPTTNNCSDKCPCSTSSDWCVNGLCTTRPRN